MPHPFELAVRHRTAALRAQTTVTQTNGHLALAPGAYVVWDAEGGAATVTSHPLADGLIHLTADITQPPDWMSFNIELGDGALVPGDIMALVVDLSGCGGHDFAPFVRTSQNGDLRDTPLEPMTGAPDRALRTVLHQTHARAALTGTWGYHTLVLPLPLGPFALSLHGLRLSVVSADRGLALHGPMLGQT